MGKTSDVEWTDATFNPWWGCTRVSPGCEKCYAESFAKRVGQSVWGVQAPRRFFGDKHWDEPRLWNERAAKTGVRRRVFCASMADVFEDRVELLPHRGRLWRLIAETEWLDWILLTKRAENLARLGDDAMRRCWVGVTAEDQRRADERVPLLLQTPAAVRFVSAEPLLGPIDFKGWGADAPMNHDAVRKDAAWTSFPWEEWIPAELRQLIEDFWKESYGRGPAAWLRDHVVQHVPRTGASVTLAAEDGGSWLTTNKMAVSGVVGRYVHLWNNIGRVVTADGKVVPTAGGSGSGWLSRWLDQGEYRPKLHWVIVGSESGPGARPMKLEWARSIVDQCVTAGVPVFTKQIANEHDRKGGDPAHWPPGVWPRQHPEVRHG